jgi:questin oxidase-like protein
MQTRHDRPQAQGVPVSTRADAIDDALDRLSAYDYTDGIGLATHGPMGAEALSTLGHDDLVAGWVEAYKARHQPIAAPSAATRLDAGDERSWRAALGDDRRLSDWADLFTRQLADEPWRDVLGAWVPRLLPGYAGGFTHGLIRTAHAVRALSSVSSVSSVSEPSPLVIAELARALAYWAGSYKALPGRPSLAGGWSLDEAVARLPRPSAPWTPIEAGQFTRMHELPDFPAAVDGLAPPASAADALSDLTATIARLIPANPDVFPIGLVHAITPIAGARTLLAQVPTLAAEQLYAQLWHVDAAIIAGFVPRRSDQPGQPSQSGLGVVDDDPPSPSELVALAVEHRDPHVVKFTEACIRENALRPDPAYLLAARHVLDRTPPW